MADKDEAVVAADDGVQDLTAMVQTLLQQMVIYICMLCVNIFMVVFLFELHSIYSSLLGCNVGWLLPVCHLMMLTWFHIPRHF